MSAAGEAAPEFTRYNPGSTYQDDTIVLFVFIGRGNPPQEAHYKIICDMIREAINHNTCALLLIGAGPNYEQTADNPVSYAERSSFLDHKLRGDGFKGGIIRQPPQTDYEKKNVKLGDYAFLTHAEAELFQGNYAIMMKNNRTSGSDISEYVKNYVEKNGKHKHPIKQVKIVQCAGTKGHDATKLGHIFKTAIVKIDKSLNPVYNVWARDVVTKQGCTLSATAVREHARNCFYEALDSGSTHAAAIHSAFGEWKSCPSYSNFYDSVSIDFFEQIIFDKHGFPYPRPGSEEDEEEEVTTGSLKYIRTQKAKLDPRANMGRGGSRRKRTRMHFKKFRNKRTIRNRRTRNRRRQRN